jgi:methyl-accepting chemotaxis protein
MTSPVAAPSSPNPADLARWTARITLLGRVIVVCAIVGTIAALVLVERMQQTFEGALTVTEQSADLVADAVEPVRALAEDLAALAVTVAEGLDATEDLLATSQAVLDDVGLAAATNLAEITDAAADVADRLARQLERIERLIPGDSQSVAEELRALSDGLQPVADQLRTLGEQLQTAADELDGAITAVVDLAARVEAIADHIDELGPTLDALSATATDLQDRAATASDRLGLDMWLMRVLVLVAGVGFAAFGLLTQRLATVLAGGAVSSGVSSGPEST